MNVWAKLDATNTLKDIVCALSSPVEIGANDIAIIRDKSMHWMSYAKMPTILPGQSGKTYFSVLNRTPSVPDKLTESSTSVCFSISLFNGVTTHVKKTLKGLIFIPGFTGRKEKYYGKRKNHPR